MSDDNKPASVRYRGLAQQCLDLLKTISDPTARASLIEMAQRWTHLAREYDGIGTGTISVLRPLRERQIHPEEPGATRR